MGGQNCHVRSGRAAVEEYLRLVEAHGVDQVQEDARHVGDKLRRAHLGPEALADVERRELPVLQLVHEEA